MALTSGYATTQGQKIHHSTGRRSGARIPMFGVRVRVEATNGPVLYARPKPLCSPDLDDLLLAALEWCAEVTKAPVQFRSASGGAK